MNIPELPLESYILPCTPENVKKARDFVKEFCINAGFSDHEVMRTLLAVEEAVINAIDHGSAIREELKFQIEYGIQDALVIIVKDYGGKHFDPEYFEEVSLIKNWGVKGGRGIHLISSMMDEVMYLSNPGKSTSVCMIKYLRN